MDKVNVSRKHYYNKKVAKKLRGIFVKEIHKDVWKIKDLDNSKDI